MFDSIGTRIAQLREPNETQQELADSLGVSRSLVKAWENDTRRIQIDNLLKLADHFHVTTDYLLGLTSVKNQDAEFRIAEKITGLRAESLERLASMKDYDQLSIVVLDTILTNYPDCLSSITNYIALSQSALRVYLKEKNDNSSTRAERLTMLQGLVSVVGRENISIENDQLPPNGTVILPAQNASDFYKQEATRVFSDLLNDLIDGIARAEIGEEWKNGKH